MGFDINCGVRLIRTNLTEKDIAPVKEQLTQSLFDHIPVGAFFFWLPFYVWLPDRDPPTHEPTRTAH